MRQARVLAQGRHDVLLCVEINQCVGCTRQFFTKSYLGDDAAILARSSGEELASPRHRAGVASMTRWPRTRRKNLISHRFYYSPMGLLVVGYLMFFTICPSVPCALWCLRAPSRTGAVAPA